MNPSQPSLSFPPELQKIADNACDYVRSHKKEIIAKFAGDSFPSVEHPISIFMAGSPGAGKTEFSKSLIQTLQNQMQAEPIVRIDGDEIRGILPGYTGANSYLFQRAISIGVSKLHDHVLEKRKNFILDGTFSRIDKARENIIRSLKVSRKTIVVCVYQDPFLSWKFTQKREAVEGRSIPKNIFIEQFFAAKEVTQVVKDEFGDQIEVWLIERNLEENYLYSNLNINKIDNYITVQYSKKQLEDTLPL
ncbi:MAG TPA: zeta toxin family protein [Candidatus Paceibacterota bacterium]